MVTGTLCFVAVITAIVCNIFTGAAKIVSLIALGLGALCMLLDAKYLERIGIEIKKLKEKNYEETK